VKRKKFPFVAALLFLVLAGCGMTPLQRINFAGKAIEKTWKHTYPRLDKRCKAEARKCAANTGAPASAPASLPACPGAQKCLKTLKAFKVALDAGDAAIIVGAPLALAKKPGADKWIKAALDALQRAVAIACKAGLFITGGNS